MGSGCRISQHLRGFDLGFVSTIRFYSFMASNNFVSSSLKPHGSILESRLRNMMTSKGASGVDFGCLQAKSPDNAPALADCFSRQEDERELPSEGSSSMTGGVVALGKFEALHIGHRELAIQASKAGIPFLLSFVGIAEVLGWEPRAPIVAKCDRKRVFSSWAPYCGNVAPVEFNVEFSSIRHLTPRQFVEKLAKEFRVNGVVAGENYRFGYKASGDASELVRLCEEYGIGAHIVNSIMDKSQSLGSEVPSNLKERGQVSSTRIRHALAEGDMGYVSELLGRKHRLILTRKEKEGLVRRGNRISAPKSCLLNLAPKEGLYERCSFLIGEEILVPCKVIIDSTQIHVEYDDKKGDCTQIPFQDCQLAAIEFGDSEGV